MTKISIYLGVALAIVLVCSQTSSAINIFNMVDQSTLRCSGGMVATGDSDREVLEKCGEPLDVQSMQDFGPVWIYHFGQSRFMHYLGFKFGRLERIASAPCNSRDYECFDMR